MHTMTPFLPFCLPHIGEEEIAEVVDCLRSGWITTGPRTKRFETEFASYVGSRHAVALNSCTAALHLALEALDLRAGDEVLIPTMTFAATAEVVRYFGAVPVLLDCNARTLNLDVGAVVDFLDAHAVRRQTGTHNRRTGARIRAVIPVHYAGLPCDMAGMCQVGQDFSLAVVEDAAHAVPARIGDRHVGTFGSAGAFSFYANKNMTTGEGGMFVTDDDELADRVRIMSLHGINRDAWRRFTADGSWFYEIQAPGYKYNLTDIAAALGLVQLRRVDALWETRRRYAALYTAALRDVAGICPPPDPPADVQHGWHLYVVRLDLSRFTINRARFIEELKALGVGTSVHYLPLHMHPYYQRTFGYRPEHLPIAADVYERLITLPLYSRMTDADVERVISAVSDVAARYQR